MVAPGPQRISSLTAGMYPGSARRHATPAAHVSPGPGPVLPPMGAPDSGGPAGPAGSATSRPGRLLLVAVAEVSHGPAVHLGDGDAVHASGVGQAVAALQDAGAVQVQVR